MSDESFDGDLESGREAPVAGDMPVRSVESSILRRLDRLAKLSWKLNRNSHFLRVAGFGALLLTMVNVISLAIGAIELLEISRNIGGFYSSSDRTFYLILNLVLSTITLVILGIIDIIRKMSDAIFQEVSDELQYFIGRRSTSKRTEFQLLLSDARIRTRRFSSAADLPLIPGRFGTAIYALVNLAILGVSIVLTVQLAYPST